MLILINRSRRLDSGSIGWHVRGCDVAVLVCLLYTHWDYLMLRRAVISSTQLLPSGRNIDIEHLRALLP